MVLTKKRKTLVVPRKLPSDLEEEILARVPPLSFLRLRSVCKGWGALLNSKRFVNKNFACGRPEIMLHTHSDIYLISVDLNDDDPTIKVTDLCINLRRGRYNVSGICDGHFFMYSSGEGGLVWNPLVGQDKRIAKDDRICGRDMGYAGREPEKSYKIIGQCGTNLNRRVAVLELTSNKELATNKYWEVTHRTPSSEELCSDSFSKVSLNGNVYWTGYNYPETGEYFLEMLDFSKERTKIFCKLPFEGEKASFHTRALSIYKGDRFSVLQQHIKTRKIKIWVTEKKIGNGDDGRNVVWIKFMTISIPDFPIVLSYMSTSYFVDNNIYGKSFVLCCRSTKPKQGWVYIVRGDLCKKIKIEGVDCRFGSSVYVPSLITISIS